MTSEESQEERLREEPEPGWPNDEAAVEQLAQAMWLHRTFYHRSWGDLPEETREGWRGAARKLLAILVALSRDNKIDKGADRA